MDEQSGVFLLAETRLQIWDGGQGYLWTNRKKPIVFYAKRGSSCSATQKRQNKFYGEKCTPKISESALFAACSRVFQMQISGTDFKNDLKILITTYKTRWGIPFKIVQFAFYWKY